MEIFRGEEKACRDEKQGHVEFEDEFAQPARCLSVGDYHQDDSDALCNRNNGIPFHF